MNICWVNEKKDLFKIKSLWNIRTKFSSVQSLSRVWLFAAPWTVAHQASLSITNSWSLLKLMSIASVLPSNHLILCHPHLLVPSIFPSIRVFSNESVLCIRWPKYWSFSFSISPSNDYSGLISFRIDWLDLLDLIVLICVSWELMRLTTTQNNGVSWWTEILHLHVVLSLKFYRGWMQYLVRGSLQK